MTNIPLGTIDCLPGVRISGFDPEPSFNFTVKPTRRVVVALARRG